VLAVALALVWFPFETERKRHAARRQANVGEVVGRLDLDPLGTILLTLAILALMYPFMAHQAWAWWLLPLAPVLLWAWVRWERGYAARGREPMVDIQLFRFRSFRNGMLVSGVMFLGIASTFAVLALFLQNGLHVPAIGVGLVGLPNAALSAWASWWSVRYVLSHGRRLIFWMLLLMALGIVLSVVVILLIPYGVPWWALAGTLSLNGFAMGAIGSANQTLSLQDVPHEHGGTAGGIKQTVERIGAALGNAMIVGIFFGLVSSGWTTALVGAYAAVTVCILAAAAIAVFDERQHRTPASA
jgi:hypothetical protein